MKTDEFENRIKTYNKIELQEAIYGIDKEKYPDRYILLKETLSNYRKIDNDIKSHEEPSVYLNQKLHAKRNIDAIVLTILSLGMYQSIWIYKNWKKFKEIENGIYSPLLRTMLFPFFSYVFYKRFEISASNYVKNSHIYPLQFAILTILVSISFTGFPEIIELILFIVAIFVLAMQVFLNYTNNKCNIIIDSNNPCIEEITTLEYVVAIFGTMFWCLAIYGLIAS